MYQVKIKNMIEKNKKIIIHDGEQFVNENREPVYINKLDEKGKIILDQNNEPVMELYLNTSGQDIEIEIKKTSEEIAAEEQALKDEKYAEIQAKCDAYKAKQEYQRKHGGPGPVAEFEIMKIANEYNGQFEVIFEEE